MKVIITGIRGYIGSVMGPYLVSRGHEVRGIDTGYYEDALLYDPPASEPPVLHLDIRRVQSSHLTGADAVIHLADLSNDPLGQMNTGLTRRINFHGAINVANAAAQAGVRRYLYASSCSVYGIASQDQVSETSAINPQTEYARCKRDVEQVLRDLASETFSPVIFRNATVYGPSPRMRFDLVVNNLVGHAQVHKKIALSSDGTPWRPLTHIEDICQAFACALEAPVEAVHAKTFNVGGPGNNYRIIDVAHIIQKAYPDCHITIGSSDGDTRSYKVSFDAILNELPGFVPQHTVKDGVLELQAVYRRIGLSKKQFEGRGHTRLKQIEYLKKEGFVDAELYWRVPESL